MLLYQIAITLIPGVGDVNAKKLISYCGSAEAVFLEKRKNLMKIPGMGPSTVDSILGNDVLYRAEKEIKFIEKYKISTCYYLDKRYPYRLKQCMDGPVMLYQRGTYELNSGRVISVVGTRKASSYGREMTEKLLVDFSGSGVLIVSGLAYGIDTLAHRVAVSNNITTTAVLAHGLDRIYPYVNRNLAIQMQENGGLLTEFLSETNPDRENFPRRNRIVAGLADAVLVIESGKKGGAMITANIAGSYSRDVFAVPGRAGDVGSEGCNALIKSNRAALVETTEDIRYFMQWDDDEKNKSRQTTLFRELQPEEEKVLTILREYKESGIDFLVMTSGLSPGKVAEALLTLEFDGLVRCLPGKMYEVV